MNTNNPQSEPIERPNETSPAPLDSPTVIDGAMQTGSGADDEPEMLVGDRHANDTPIDPDGDGVFSVAEAQDLLGGDSGAPPADTSKSMDTEKVTT